MVVLLYRIVAVVRYPSLPILYFLASSMRSYATSEAQNRMNATRGIAISNTEATSFTLFLYPIILQLREKKCFYFSFSISFSISLRWIDRRSRSIWSLSSSGSSLLSSMRMSTGMKKYAATLEHMERVGFSVPSNISSIFSFLMDTAL